MAYRNLLTSDRGGVRTIAVNRPDKHNALDRATLGELTLAFQQARADADVRVVVLTGAGDKAFVAGADIAAMSGLSAAEAFALCFASADMREGTRAFLERRKPLFSGR